MKGNEIMSTCKQLAGLLLLTTALTVPTALQAQGTGGDANAGPAATPPAPPADVLEDVEGVDTAAPGQDAGEDAEQEADISIPGGGGNTIVVTGRVNRDPVRGSGQVISVLSTEQIARTGEGDIAGALSRVTGLSLQENGRVYVRGLGDRYSLALLNGLPLPSPEPLSRVVPLDIFPTSIVASSLVQKTYSANFPGEFGGGLINLTTLAVPDESFLTIGAGLSGDLETTFGNGLAYYGSGSDWTGFDDGARDLPGELTAFYGTGQRLDDLSAAENETVGKSLVNPNFVTLQTIGDLPANWSASISGGTSFDVGADGRLGIIATASYGNRWRNRGITRQTGFGAVDSDELTVATDFFDFTTDNRLTLNALLGLGLEIGEHQFRWTNLYIRDTQKQASLASGDVFVGTNDGSNVQNQETAWYERQLIDSQFVGELEFGPLSVDLRGGFARTDREAPYEYSFTYVRTNRPGDPYGGEYINLLDGTRGDASVVYSDLYEELWYGGIDFSYEVLDTLRATVGYAYSDTDRYSERREFQFQSQGFANNPLRGIGLLQPRFLLQPSVFDYRARAEANNAANPSAPLPVFNIRVRELTQSNPAFEAALLIHAGYAQVDFDPIESLSLNLGVRYEDAEQSVTPLNLFSTPINLSAATQLSNAYWLPAATLTYRPMEDLQLRLSASRTLARPQFRELIFQPYTDPETNRDYIGNPALQDSELFNAEARVEYYLPNRSRVSLAGFYKKIDNPIEPYSQFSDNNQLILYANAPSAELYGAEAEVEYNYDLYDLGGVFETKQIVAVANYTYTQSQLQVNEDDTTFTFDGNQPVAQPASVFFIDGAPLTGQSDHLVNFQLSLEDTEVLEQISLLLSYASERVTSRGGGNNLPDVVEDPGFRLDLVVRKGVPLFGLDTELKLEARNILGRGHEEFQDRGANRLEINSYDVGQSLAASLSVTF
jgi:TonB-dependent receptor